MLDFENNLKKLRIKNGMNQSELASKINVTQQTVSSWERGAYPDIFILRDLAELFDITIDELVFPEPRDNNKLDEQKYLYHELLPLLTDDEKEQLKLMIEFFVYKKRRS